MKLPRPFAGAALLFAAAAVLVFPKASDAAVNLVGTVTFDAGANLYSYSYSVTNTGADQDLALITIPVDPAANLMGLSAPTGFELTFDPSQGWINLNEDSSIITDQTFAPGSTVAPFQFTSVYAPVSVTYTAFDAAGSEFSGSIQSPSPVPEPSATLFSSLALGLAGCLSRRRSR